MYKSKIILIGVFINLGCSQGTKEVAPQLRVDSQSLGTEHGQDKNSAKNSAPPNIKSESKEPIDKTKDSKTKIGPLFMQVPEGWTQTTPSSSMRLDQYKVSDAEFVVFYFGENGAGTTEANIDRWTAQFKDPKTGQSPEAKTSEITIGKHAVTKTEVEGSFAASMGPMLKSSAKENKDWAMRGAIIQTSKGPYYFKLIGPSKTIQAEQSNFDAFLNSINN